MKSVMTHQFSRVPRAQISRSSFNRSSGYKTGIDAGKLYPIFCDEVLPGDTFKVNAQVFARMATPIHPIMDNVFLDQHWFFVAYRNVWDNWERFCGSQDDPSDSTDYTIPVLTGTAVAGTTGQDSLWDFFGLPVPGAGSELDPDDFTISALPFRAYQEIWNEWFRDQNLQDSLGVAKDDGPDTLTTLATPSWNPADNKVTRTPLSRGKRHDYFTSCLPWPQKGDSVDLPLGSTADVKGIGIATTSTGTGGATTVWETGEAVNPSYPAGSWSSQDSVGSAILVENVGSNTPAVYADLSTATAATINQLRQAFQIQKLLERDARGGTRYKEVIKAHFGVDSADARLDRPEFLGSSTTMVNISQVPQTSETSGSPQGNLAAFGTAAGNCRWTKSFTEHGVVIGLVSVRADLTYQQGINRMWTRQTRYDFFWPALQHLGEQAVLNQEIYADTAAAGTNENVFGYQERFAEYRYKPSQITGVFRSSAASSLDAWHLSQEFGSLPTLGNDFIKEDPPFDRVVAVPSEPDFIMDSFINLRCARPMPLYGVPGLIDHF